MKHLQIRLLSFCAIGLLAIACGPQDINVGNGIESRSGTIYGVVVREADASERAPGFIASADDAATDPNLIPVNGARLSFAGLSARAESQPDGTFEIKNVPAGKHVILIDKDTDNDGNNDLASDRIEIEVPKNKRTDLGHLLIEKTGTIHGRVRLEGRETGNQGIIAMIPGTGFIAATDDAGNFTMFFVRKGHHDIIASTAGYGVGRWESIKLKSGDEVTLPTIDLQVADPSAVGSLEGSAFLSDARDHTGIVISLSNSSIKANTTRYGKYSISNAPEAIYQVTFTKAGYRSFTVNNVPVLSGAQAWELDDVYLVPGDDENSDTDNDGIPDDEDSDLDGDGLANDIDAFPENGGEWLDTDGDDMGNNADYDDDDDGVPDANDAFPLEFHESVDTDDDGTGDNADLDDDNDGTPDVNDDFPTDADEDTDTDGDGTGNNADTDDDGDGIPDADDAYPLDSRDTIPPMASILASPAAATSTTEATLTFSCGEPLCTMRCSLDGEEFSNCASPLVYSDLADGLHEFSVIAVDNIGNEQFSPTTVTWNIELPYGPRWSVPDSGITSCYSNYIAMGCQAEGQPYFGQDYQYSINPTSYTNNGNGTISDNITGLMWQRSDDTVLRSWRDSLDYCDSLNLGGHTDWRLPNYYELDSIVDYGQNNPSIDDKTFLNADDVGYWTSTERSDSRDEAWYIVFTFGNATTHTKPSWHLARCVRL